MGSYMDMFKNFLIRTGYHSLFKRLLPKEYNFYKIQNEKNRI